MNNGTDKKVFFAGKKHAVSKQDKTIRVALSPYEQNKKDREADLAEIEKRLAAKSKPTIEDRVERIEKFLALKYGLESFGGEIS